MDNQVYTDLTQTEGLEACNVLESDSEDLTNNALPNNYRLRIELEVRKTKRMCKRKMPRKYISNLEHISARKSFAKKTTNDDVNSMNSIYYPTINSPNRHMENRTVPSPSTRNNQNYTMHIENLDSSFDSLENLVVDNINGRMAIESNENAVVTNMLKNNNNDEEATTFLINNELSNPDSSPIYANYNPNQSYFNDSKHIQSLSVNNISHGENLLDRLNNLENTLVSTIDNLTNFRDSLMRQLDTTAFYFREIKNLKNELIVMGNVADSSTLDLNNSHATLTNQNDLTGQQKQIATWANSDQSAEYTSLNDAFNYNGHEYQAID